MVIGNVQQRLAQPAQSLLVVRRTMEVWVVALLGQYVKSKLTVPAGEVRTKKPFEHAPGNPFGGFVSFLGHA